MSRKRMKLLRLRKVSRIDWLRYPGRKCMERHLTKLDYDLGSYIFTAYYISVYDLYRYKHVMKICRRFESLSKAMKKKKKEINSKMKLFSI